MGDHDVDCRRPWIPAANQANNASIAIGIEQLTPRQQHLLRLLASGATAADLTVRLGLSARVAGRERRAMLATLAVDTVPEAARLWWGSRAGARADLRAAAEHRRPAVPGQGSVAA
jgi:DNA-binding CsgD family transcriptional regulator